MRVSTLAILLSASLLRAGETCPHERIEGLQANNRLNIVDSDGATFRLDDAGTGPRLFRFNPDGATGWMRYYNSGIDPEQWAANRAAGGPLLIWQMGATAGSRRTYFLQLALDAVTGDSLDTDTLAVYPDESVGGSFIRMRDGGAVACLGSGPLMQGVSSSLTVMRLDGMGKKVWSVPLAEAATAFANWTGFQFSGGREMEDGRILISVSVMASSTKATSMLLFLLNPATGAAEILGSAPEIPCFIARNTKDTQYMTYGLLPFSLNVNRADGTTFPWLAKVWVEEQGGATGMRRGRESARAEVENAPGLQGRKSGAGGQIGFRFGGRGGSHDIYTADGCRAPE